MQIIYCCSVIPHEFEQTSSWFDCYSSNSFFMYDEIVIDSKKCVNLISVREKEF